MWHYLSGVDLEDFMRVGQLLRLVTLGRKKGTVGGGGTVKVRGSPSVLKYAATSSAISHMCLGLSAFGETGQRGNLSPWLCVYETRPAAAAATQQVPPPHPPGDAAQKALWADGCRRGRGRGRKRNTRGS